MKEMIEKIKQKMKTEEMKGPEKPKVPENKYYYDIRKSMTITFTLL